MRSSGALREPEPTALCEQQLGLELLRAIGRRGRGRHLDFNQLMYRRTATKEVDFSGPQLDPLAIEAKYIDSGWRAQTRTLRASFRVGILASRGAIDTSGDIWAIPAPLVAWLLSH
ncbi:MAG TPA: hypothetical protein VKU89_00005 [Solirubrobacteraceae bacterium]|nr:hypothetical protein [Solirubrobacteraceae bacterium]